MDFFAGLIGSVPGSTHRFVIHTSNPRAGLSRIRSFVPHRLVDGRAYVRSGTAEEDLASCDALVVHHLDPAAARLASRAPGRLPVVWSGWGSDYYHLLAGGDAALLGPETSRLVRRTFSRKAKTALSPAWRLYLRHRWLLPAIRRVRLFSAPIPGDYELLRLALGSAFAADFIQLNYAEVEASFALRGDGPSGADIAVGNSATPTNNHVEVFRMLANHDLRGRKVVVSLSYGPRDYREAVIAAGRRFLGAHFEPLVDFLPLRLFNSRLSRCSIAVMNHYRQQALGTIGSLMHAGAKLVLAERGATYAFFRGQGAHVVGTGLLNGTSETLFRPLSDQERNHNRSVLEAFWGRDRVRANVEHFLRTIDRLSHA